jgi:hypothetical protein
MTRLRTKPTGHWEWRRLLEWPNGQLCENFPTTEPAARDDCDLAFELAYIHEQRVTIRLQRRWVADWETVDEVVASPLPEEGAPDGPRELSGL